MKTIKVRKNKKTGKFYLKLSDFKEFIDVSKVKSYQLEPVEDCGGGEDNLPAARALVLRFFDKFGQIVEAKKGEEV